jgi:hypothetical protein
MKILSNYSVQYLEEKVEELRAHLITYKNKPYILSILKDDLHDAKLMLTEAKYRCVVGYDIGDNSLAYLAGDVLYVTGKPSGWSVTDEVRKGTQKEVCYDGGTNWWSTVLITVSYDKNGPLPLIKC